MEKKFLKKKILFSAGAVIIISFFNFSHKASADVIDFQPPEETKVCPLNLKLKPVAAKVGDSVSFYVDDYYDYRSRQRVTATIRKESEKAYFFVENDWWDALDSSKQSRLQNIMNNLGVEFDTVIYSKLTQELGPIWSPGIDGDEKITILFTRLIDNAAGYFNPRDEYLSTEVSNTNEREMIYLNVLNLESSRLKSFLAHEFQHLITFYNKNYLNDAVDDIWLNEMRSEYTSTILGYDSVFLGSNLEDRLDDFLRSPSDSLTEWGGNPSDYGSVMIFAQYLADQYGENLISYTVQNKKIGIESINEALAKLGSAKNFSDIFTDWVITVYFNDTTIGDGRYGYKNSNLKNARVSPTNQYQVSAFSNIEISRTLKDWQPFWYKFTGTSGGRLLKFDFNGKFLESNFKIPYVTISNSGDKSINFVNLTNQSGIAYISGFGDNISSVIFIPSNQFKADNFSNNDPLSSFSFNLSSVALSIPVISNISPTFVSTKGGDVVTVEGFGFEPGFKAYFNETIVNDVIFVSSSMIKIPTPAHAPGLVDIKIENPNSKTALFAQILNYKSPIIDGSLIRAKGDYKVYIINGDFKRHILDGKIFDFYGHLNWAAIQEVEPNVRDSYKDSYLVRAANDKKVYEINGDKTKHWLNMTAENFTSSGRLWESVFIINDAERDFYRTGADALYR